MYQFGCISGTYIHTYIKDESFSAGAGQGMGILVGSVTWYGKLVSWEIGQQGFGGSWQVKAVRGARRAR